MRAPLRSITGFSAVLLEDYKDELDTEGKSYLKKISDSGELMGQLMDDLLKLSRVTRSDLNLEKLDLSDMARKIVDELRKDEPKRKVKITIAPNMTANGDKNLLGLVLQNLLGNAWKYSSKTSEPRIEMGTVEHNGKRAYFVRDNGVGFDMTYAINYFSLSSVSTKRQNSLVPVLVWQRCNASSGATAERFGLKPKLAKAPRFTLL